MSRIKELDDALKLVDEMPREQQLECVKRLVREVVYWEERVSFHGTPLEFLVARTTHFEAIRKSRR